MSYQPPQQPPSGGYDPNQARSGDPGSTAPMGGNYPPNQGGYPPNQGGSYTPPPPPQYGAPYGAPARPAGTSWAAIVTLVCGILALTTFCLPPIAAIFGLAALVFFFVSRGQVKQGQGGNVLAIIGLVLGILGVVIGIAIYASLISNPAFISGLSTALATLTPGP